MLNDNPKLNNHVLNQQSLNSRAWTWRENSEHWHKNGTTTQLNPTVFIIQNGSHQKLSCHPGIKVPRAPCEINHGHGGPSQRHNNILGNSGCWGRSLAWVCCKETCWNQCMRMTQPSHAATRPQRYTALGPPLSQRWSSRPADGFLLALLVRECGWTKYIPALPRVI